MDLLNYILNEAKNKRIEKLDAISLIRQYQSQSSGAAAAALHPLVQRNTSDLQGQRFSTRFTGKEFFLADHIVQGKPVLPGVAYLEMARAALAQAGGITGDAAVRLKDVLWLRPMVVEDAVDLHIALYEDAPGVVGFEIYSGDELVHSQGTAETFDVPAPEQLDLAALRAQCGSAELAGSDCYAGFAALGLAYGPAQQAIEVIHVGAGRALARLQLPTSVASTADDYVLHPSLLDAGLQAVAGLTGAAQDGQLALPFAVREVEIVGRCSAQMWALVTASGDSTAQVRKYDVTLCDAEGVVCVRLKGFATRVVDGQLGASSVLLLQPNWQERQATGTEPQYVERHVIAPSADTDYGDAVQQLCAEVQAIFQRKPSAPVLLQVVVPATGPRQVLAGLAGVLKTARQEQPKLIGQLIAVEEGEEGLEAKLAENAACPQDVQIRYVQGRRQVAGWQEMTAEAQMPWKADGVYLITGALGGLGQVLALEIGRQARGVTLVLTGRRDLDDAGRQCVRSLEALGATVAYHRLDVTDRDAVRQLLLHVQEEHQALHGIVHAAGVLRDGLLLTKTPEDIAAVLAPKVAGLRNLDEASRDIELDWLLCFSSTSAALGNVGQADYAAANGFMDSFAHHRNELVAQGSRHGRMVSVNWPLWQEGGMRLDAAALQAMQQATGLTPLASDAGLQALYSVFGSGSTQAMVLSGSVAKIRQRMLGKAAPVEAPQAAAPAQDADGGLEEKVRRLVFNAVSSLLKVRPEDIDGDAELSEFGLDSVMLTEFGNRFNQDYQVALTPTIFFEYPTFNGFARYLAQEHREAFAARLLTPGTARPVEAPAPAAAPPVSAKASRRRARPAAPVAARAAAEPIAIVGMSGCFPMARDLQAFWDNLRGEKDCISEIPAERWDWQALFGDPLKEANKCSIKWGGFIDGMDEFDPLFFGISPKEAEVMDPQQRLLMTYVWKAIEDAGYAPASLSGSRSAIYVGTGSSGYGKLIAEAGMTIEGYSATGMVPSVGPNRMSYLLNLHGPSEPVETACSSSLIALRKGVLAIQNGGCELAIVGGVSTIVTPEAHISFNKAGMLSEDGRCKTFSAQANGYVRGEGVGMLVLKRLSAAERDGDHIYGLVSGTAENHGGRASSLTAPNPKAQADLLKEAYQSAGVDPRSVSYIEAHGTGTPLGDPIEVNGLKMAFKALYQDAGAPEPEQPHCALGSVKTNIGHLELAAGVAGVIKVLLQLKHKTLVKTLHCDEVNPYIDLKGSPFYLVRETQEWAALRDAQGRELPRRAGVSSFGFGGVNAHVVIEEYRAPARASHSVTPEQPAVVLLSAKDEDGLHACAQQLLAAITHQGWGDEALADLAYTLQVGRDAMEERLALTVDSMAQLAERLHAFLDGKPGMEGVYRGQVRKNRETMATFAADEDMARTVDAWLAKGKLHKVLDLWVKGMAFDWKKLHAQSTPRRMSLPSYPFARERYWVSASSSPARLKGVAAALHPLLQRNTSDLSGQRFSTQLSGDEFFLADHVVQGRRLLPGVAYLEMAREALVQANGADAGVRISDVVWARPLVADGAIDVHVGLHPHDDGAVEFEIYSGEHLVHSHGMLVPLASDAEERLDVAALRAACGLAILSGPDCYERFASLGLAYGPAQQAIDVIHVGVGQALARLLLPAKVAATINDYVLHPSLLDAALQSVAGMAGADGAPQLALPFAVQEIDVVGRCSAAMWAWVRPVAGSTGQERVRKYDITLCDDDGVVCVSLKGFATRPAEGTLAANPLTLLAPVWDVVTPALGDAPVGRVLVIGGTPAQQEMLRQYCPQAQTGDLAQGDISHLVWIAPDAGMIAPDDERMIAAQQDGVLECFRLVKSLLAAGYGSRALDLSVFTTSTQAVHHEAIIAAHAGLQGLIGTLAKEYPNWKVRLADLPREGSWPWAELLRLAPDAQGNGLAWRAGQWYRQQLLPAQVTADQAASYRQGGVYVVIGGAGGIGEVWTEHLIRKHAAQVIWIGRRAQDADITSKIERLAGFGPAPLYIAADATDRQALEQAYRQVKQQFGAIHGVVHAAIVLRDQSLANMDEERFASSLSAKVDVSVRLAQVFAGEALDFVLFFSSLQSFTKAAGQGNYAAGCTFKDAFAQQLAQHWPCRVRVMNWGWWGSVGIVATDAYRDRMAQQGLASIEAEDGMAALETLLGGSAQQLALLKTTPQAAQRAQFAETVQVFKPDYPSLIGTLDTSAGKTPELAGQSEAEAFDSALQAMLGRLLCGQLQQLGWRAGSANNIGLQDKYDRWFEQTLRLLAEQGHLQQDAPTIDLAATWAEWDSRKTAWLENPAARAQVILVETMLRALPEILQGTTPATDVMFPGSSMRLVEGIYKHNPVADYFNAVLADAVVAFVQARLTQDPAAKIRILEIGAGTGGTSAVLFERLRPYAASIGQYCYTDLSKAFLFHAEKQYGPANPYLHYQLLDVGRPLAEQDVTPGSYDLVVATNVLHATRNIRQSVRNAKAALRNNGLLLLNEISRSHVFTHLTFGLLEGWWLYEDAELRIPGCPGLSAQGWRTVLQDEGFASVIYPAGDKEALGQQIIAADSDGVARQRARSAPQPVEVPDAQPAAPSVQAAAPPRSQPQGQLHERAVAYLKALLAKTLKLPSHKINSAASLETYGIDSILVVELTTALQGVFANVSSTLFFEYRTIDELAAHFIATQPEALAKVLQLDGAAPEPVRAAAPAPVKAPRTSSRRVTPAPAAPQAMPARQRDVAIVGMSGRYAQARNVDEFWDNLKQGRNCITEIPADRWDHKLHFDPQKGTPGKSYSKWGGFIEGVDQFDPLFFQIAPREAQFMDPQERLFLAEAYASIEDAGYTPAGLSHAGKVGVFAGVMNSNYGSGTRYWSIANRVSYLFNFQGPSLAVDTACSASLTALHLAVESLRSGACDTALVGGVNLIIDPAQYATLSAMSMLSAGDKCRAFGDHADGFVDGEGVGVVVLKPLEQAVADGDTIYGVIKASAINHGGKTNGYTVPNPHAQAAAISRALQDADIDPRTISYLEAHGTGTALGDPIEIAGLGKAFGTGERQFCAIGSVKSNIGHCESAAGVAGITKVLLQLKHGQLAPSLHAEVLNPHIDFAATPFAVQRELGEWKRPMLDIGGRTVEVPRRAGISSFGAGGSNAHVVIEEYVAPAAAVRSPTADEPALVMLSAKNEERLRERVQRLVDAIAAKGWGDEHLSDLAYTLQVGREAMDDRLALVVTSMAELKAKLQAYLAGEEGIDELYLGQVKRNKEAMAVFAADEELQEAIARWVERKKYSKLLDLWTKGLAFDWNVLYADSKPRRMSLPSYPFAKERHWLERPAAQAVAPAPAAPEARLNLLAPVWVAEQPTRDPAKAAGSAVLIVGGTALQQDTLRRQYSQAQIADFAAGDSIASIADALAAHDAFDHVVWIAPHVPAHEGMIAAQQEGVLHGFRLIKALLAAGYGARALAWSVFTTQTQALTSNEAVAPAHAGIHGLIGVLAKEYPNWPIRLVDFPAAEAWPMTEALALPADPQGSTWAWRDGQWYRQHLQPAELAPVTAAPYRQGGVYVVIGGAGGIGEAWSEHVIREYGAQVVWIGRRLLDAQIAGRIAHLAQFGPAPLYIAADATDRAALQGAHDEVLQRFGAIHGIIHSALVLGDQSLANMEEARFGASLASKVDVSVRLAEVFAGASLDFVLLFSSLQSFARGAGQSNYAAGCTFKDAFARHLGQLWPCPVKVMNWGWWGSVGVAAAPAYQARMKQLGLASIEPEEGWNALAQLLAGPYSQLGLLKTAAPLPAKRAPVTTPKAAQGATVHQQGVEKLKEMVGALLHMSAQQIDAEESLAAYGIDSISVTHLSAQLGAAFEDINQALFFDYQTIDDLAAHLLATQPEAFMAWVGADAAPQEVAAAPLPSVEVVPAPAKEAGGDVAIVGMACRFPGADSVDAYWQMLQSGAKADNRGPSRRWPGQAANAWGAFLDDIDQFDPAYFGMSSLHAECVDPQERLFLMSCWHALEDAGYGDDKVLAERSRAGEDVGVFVGVTAATYNLIGFEQGLAGNPQATVLSFASIANRVSHALGLTGPSLSVDTMCSSSLVALHMACESLRSGECGMAIAGGVNLNLHPSRLDGMARGKLICEDGESHSFGAGGKGFLAGEGVASVILKPLDAAMRDGDTIHAVIKGSAVGHSGTTLNYFAPSSRGQGRVIAKALESAGMVPDQVAYVEMQCVGDEATDAAEFDAVKHAYQSGRRQVQPLRLGSVKPNVGHAEAAAGMVQLIKVVLQLKHRTFAPTLLGGEISPQLNFAGGHLAIQRELEVQVAAEPLRMAVNAAGAGGTAAHVIVEAGPAPALVSNLDEPQLLVLSARSRASLRRSAAALAQRLATAPLALADVAYTLQVGRRPQNHRLALVARSVDEAVNQLRAWLDGEANAVLVTPEEGMAPLSGELPAQGDLAGLAHSWVRGAAIDWRKTLAKRGGRRVSLPGYKFDLRRCWPGASETPAVGAPVPVSEPVAAGAQAGLLQSIVTPADAAAYLDEQIKSIAEHVQLATVGIIYAVLQDKGVKFEERRTESGLLALYPQVPGGDPAATERLLEQFTAGETDVAGAAGKKGLSGRVMKLAGRLLKRLPGGGEKAAGRILTMLPGAEGLTTAYLLKLLARTAFLVTDEGGARLALPPTIRSRKQLDDLRLQAEISLRALPEYQSYCELLVAILSGILDGQRPGQEQLDAASTLLVDMFTAPSKLAFLHRMTADLCLVNRFAGREKISVLALGAGGFEVLSAIVAAAPEGARIDCQVVAGWPQIAKGICELGRERFPGVSFGSFVPMVPGALKEHLGQKRYDVVTVNLQDPCAQEAASLLDKLATDPRGSLVFVSQAVQTQAAELIFALTGMWPQAATAHSVADGAALGESLVRAGCLRQVIIDPVLTVYSREGEPGEGAAVVDEAALADIRAFLLQTFAAAIDDGSTIDAQRNLAEAGLSSMTWALIFAKLQQRFGPVIEASLFAELGAAPNVETLAQLLAAKLHGGEAPPAAPPIPADLAGLVMGRLVDVGRTEVVFDHAAQLTRGEFTSSRGQVYEYFEHGSGPALIFLTALAFGKSVWEDQIREFGGRYRLIFPHLPGHAGSVHTGLGFTFEQVADDLVELMDALDVPEADLVGWCIAGNIAQLLALRHPQRLKSLVLVCTTPTDARMRGITQKDLEDYSVSPLLTYQLEFNNIYHEEFLAPEVLRSLAIIRQTHIAVDSQALLSFIGSLFQFDTRERLQDIRVPTLVIAGSKDIAFPIEQVALLKDGIPQSRFVVVEKGGHLPFLNQSGEFNAAVGAFLIEARVRRPYAMP